MKPNNEPSCAVTAKHPIITGLFFFFYCSSCSAFPQIFGPFLLHANKHDEFLILKQCAEWSRFAFHFLELGPTYSQMLAALWNFSSTVHPRYVWSSGSKCYDGLSISLRRRGGVMQTHCSHSPRTPACSVSCYSVL